MGLIPPSHVTCSVFWAAVNSWCLVWGIMELIRLKPFHPELQCEAPFTVIPLEKLSMPSLGLFANWSSSAKCVNSGPASIKIKASGSKIEWLLPNATDLALGGPGLPYSVVGTVEMLKDAWFRNGAEGQMATFTQIHMSPQEVLAVLGPASRKLGYVPIFTRSVQVVEMCTDVLGTPNCFRATDEQFCGSFSGTCLAARQDEDGVPLVPEQMEPAICRYTKSLCGEEADVKAKIEPRALGLSVLTTVPCPLSSGLPNTSFCNVISATGIDSNGHAHPVEPSVKLTSEALRKKEERWATAEEALQKFPTGVMVVNAVCLVLNLAMALTCFTLRRRHEKARSRSAAAKDHRQPTREIAGPTLMQSRVAAFKHKDPKVRDEDNSFTRTEESRPALSNTVTLSEALRPSGGRNESKLWDVGYSNEFETRTVSLAEVFRQARSEVNQEQSIAQASLSP
eukprot:TRINITY_DN13648_c0_g2_i1.p1 TRINITY_DN13648_c0_g2~~TRINITY_DN13648_c0_g2_i1.p1  ORF type:complete len:483 (+),score=80.15 TRINITY_DN13648_c0_g2_i1:92-1450(+)